MHSSCVCVCVCVFTRAPGVNNLRHITHFQDSVCPSKKLSFIIKQLAAHWSPASCNCSCSYCCWYHCVVIIAVVCALLELIINVYFVFRTFTMQIVSLLYFVARRSNNIDICTYVWMYNIVRMCECVTLLI